MILLAFTLACRPEGLPADALAARDALRSALQTRDPAQVSTAARAAGAWRGQDPELERLLGDALANVLMRPGEGLALLEQRPAPDDPAWTAAIRGAAIRVGDAATLARVRALTGQPEVALDPDVVDQVATRARLDPTFPLDELDDVNARCGLLGHRPRAGRKDYRAPLPAHLEEAARALGATVFALGRTPLETDGDPLRGQGLYLCRELRLLPALPTPFPGRLTVFGASDGRTNVYLEARMEEEGPWIFAVSHAEWGPRWARAAAVYNDAGGGAAGAAKVRELLGPGLAGSAFSPNKEATPAPPR